MVASLSLNFIRSWTENKFNLCQSYGITNVYGNKFEIIFVKVVLCVYFVCAVN
jgi:hypothetical protein